MTYDEHDTVATLDGLLTEHGLVGRLDPAQLDRVDQFHAGGGAAVDRTVAPLGLTPEDRVLDVGSGLGGPARRIADQTGAMVVGVDITADYVAAATYLTGRCGLEDLVRFEASSIDAHAPDRPYTAALSMHVQMNVADKAGWYRAIAERLVDGGRLVVWDICTTGDHDLPYPMPWSMDGSDSHLATPDELHAAILDGGFTSVAWVDEGTWVNEWLTATFANGLPSGPGLPMLLDEGFARMINLGVATADGNLTVMRGEFVASTTSN